MNLVDIMRQIARFIDRAYMVLFAMIVIDVLWVVLELIQYGEMRSSFEDFVIGLLFAISLVQNYEDWKWRRRLK